MWIVTREHNAYDQFGEYFVAVFKSKPDFHQLSKTLRGECLSDACIGRLTRGCSEGEVHEDVVWNLKEVICGKPYG